MSNKIYILFCVSPIQANKVIEYNDIPGLSGFPDEVKIELANCLK